MPLIQVDQQTRFLAIKQNDFSGLLNTRDIDALIGDTELSAIENFTRDRRGALKVRPGFVRMTKETYGSGAIRGLEPYYKVGGNPEIIATQGTSIGKFNSATQLFEDIKTDLSGDDKKFNMHQFMNHFYMANEVDKVQVYDGVNIWDAGYTIPASAPSSAQGDTGVLKAGTYKHKVTYYYKDGESNPCESEASIVIIDDKKINLTSVPTGNSRVTMRKLYRTIKDGEEFFLLTTINDNTTTTYEDNIPDSGLGATMDEDNFEPPVSECTINHKGRMWYLTSSTLWYSKALHPEAVTEYAYWDIGRDDGDILIGVKVNLGALIIFKKYSTWVITGDTPTGTSPDMVLEKVNPSIGNISNATASHAANDLLFLTPNLGIQRLHRVLLASTETMDAQALSDKISGTLEELNRAYLEKAHSVVHGRKFYLFVPYGVGQEECNYALVLDLLKMYPSDDYSIAWTIYTNHSFTSSCLYLDSEGEHILAGGLTGHLYELATGATDDGQPIVATASTKWLGEISSNIILRSLYNSGRASEDYSYKLRIYRNEGKNIIKHDLYTFEGGGEVPATAVLFDTLLFDSVLFDNDTGYTNVVYDFVKSKLLTRRGRLFKVKIEQVSANQEFTWYGFELTGYLMYRRPLA